LTRARAIFAAAIPEDAARDAYLAAFHAAQALIAERTGKSAKTHRGVHIAFARPRRVSIPSCASSCRNPLA
jgi:uncharacterized protein (UPF0332 family)